MNEVQRYCFMMAHNLVHKGPLNSFKSFESPSNEVFYSLLPNVVRSVYGCVCVAAVHTGPVCSGHVLFRWMSASEAFPKHGSSSK